MKPGTQTHIRHWMNLLITVAGGFMDAYSYLARGQVFATGQTGNQRMALTCGNAEHPSKCGPKDDSKQRGAQRNDGQVGV